MNRKEAMEWAGRYYSEDAYYIGDAVEQLADLFQQATEGLYRIGEAVEIKCSGEWESATVKAEGDGARTINETSVRPLPKKRPKTEIEIDEELNDSGYPFNSMVKFETKLKLATDLGIDLETEE